MTLKLYIFNRVNNQYDKYIKYSKYNVTTILEHQG